MKQYAHSVAAENFLTAFGFVAIKRESNLEAEFTVKQQVITAE